MAAPANNSSNLRQRLITAALLGGGFLAAILALPDAAWMVLVVLVMTTGAWEWAGLVKVSALWRGIYLLLTPLLGLALLPSADAYFWAIIGLFWLLAVPLWLRLGWPMPTGPAGLLLGLLVMVPTGVAAIALRQLDPKLLLAVIGIAVVADTAAYFTGRRFGRHKLAPSISPGKTWEGAAGALAGVCVYALAIATGFETCGLDCLGKLFTAAVVLLAASIYGDLFESHAKRQAGVKDSSQILPGHGGMLDRIDSLTAVMPTAMLLWTWLK